MKIKRIVGMANNECNSVIAELDNGFYAWVPTLERDGPVDYKPDKSDYAHSFVIWSKWVPLILNGWVPPENFDIAMRNFKKLFTEVPIDKEMTEKFTRLREDPFWAEEEKVGEDYCNREYDASNYDFMNDLREIFSSPVDPAELPI